MTTPTRTTPAGPPCWYDWKDLDGFTKVDLPSERLLRVRWDVDILDPEAEPSHKIIDAGDPFKVHFRLALMGDLWTCMAADWWFDLGFTPIGDGTGFDLSELSALGGSPQKRSEMFWVRGWTGCRTRCIELWITVPANTIPTELCGTLYECGGKFQMYCCGKPAPVVGFERLEEYQFFQTALDDEP